MAKRKEYSWDLKKRAKELRERRELMEQLKSPIITGDNISEVL